VVDEHCDAGDPFECRRVNFQIFVGQIISEHKKFPLSLNFP
jgi:hypothetical protein